ncbi:MAG: hypothetical protein KatS3mg068_1909 [Candidatus Sericytochromatia bacterium]|nr:MAG: hypothetical protein KatS3mg068_1909 [Candidatus Sericytochromatia bacterium]
MIKDYEIIKQIGSGGMGAVYLARDPRLDRNVAIKKIKLGVNVEKDVHKEVLQRFYREARAIASLNHPNIVTIYELGEDTENKECFMVMEYLEGKSLEALISEENLNETDIIKILIQACEALSYMHKKNVIHRDIKPGNLIYCDNGLLKLTDFGLVRLDDNLEITRSGTLLGSVLYMSPEQIENPKNVDSRVDIYALGVTAFQLLSGGNFPYNGDNVWDVIKNISKNQPYKISKFNPNIDNKLEAIIMKAISKSLLERYKEISELQIALLEYNSQNYKTSISPITYINSSIEEKLKNTNNVKTNTKTTDPNIVKTEIIPEFKQSNPNFAKTEIISDFKDSFPKFSKTEIIQDFDKSIDINLSIDNINNYFEKNSEIVFKYLKNLANEIEENINKFKGNMEYIFKVKDNLLFSIEELLNEINKMVKEYNSHIASRNYLGVDLNELKRKIDIKKSILSSKRKEEEFINQKIDLYKKLIDVNNSKLNLLNILVFIFSVNSIFNSNSIFEVSDNEIDNLKNIIKNIINNYFNLKLYKNTLLKNIDYVNNIFNSCPYIEPIGQIIRTIPKSNAIEVKLLDDLENNVLLEIENNNNDILFANCNIYENSKQVHKAKSGRIIILKSEEFSDEVKKRINTNNKIFKFKQRLINQNIIEEEKEFLNKIKEQLDNFISYYENKLNELFNNFDKMFLLENETNFSPETKQFTIVKVNKIKKNLLDLKKELEIDNKINIFLEKINSIILNINKFPVTLKNIEDKIKQKKEQRKKAFSNIFIQVSKLNTKEINNQIESLFSSLEKLEDLPSSLITFLKFFIYTKAGLPTGKSKNEVVNGLNNEREFLSTFEIDTICRTLNVKYNREKGFIIKVGL